MSMNVGQNSNKTVVPQHRNVWSNSGNTTKLQGDMYTTLQAMIKAPILRIVRLSDTVKAKKLAYYGHTMRKHGSCLEKEIMQGTVPGARRRGRPRTAWMDNIKTLRGRVNQNDRGQG